MQPKKQWLYSGDKPLWLQVADDFALLHDFFDIIIVSSREEIAMMKYFAPYRYTQGGKSRQESLSNGLKLVESPYVLVSDVARCCLDSLMIERILAHKGEADSITPTLGAVDTIYLGGTPVDRAKIKRIQTPQLSKTKILQSALSSGVEYTDESSAIVANGGSVLFVEGSVFAHKLTSVDDLPSLPCIKRPFARTLTGFGIDIHPFEEGKKMVLCGVTIDVPYGFKAHSDGDVAIHALIDALLGAAGMGDIGEHFPDTDSQYAGADSRELLTHVLSKIHAYGYTLVNVDLAIIAQTPRLMEYKEAMRYSLASLLGLRANFVNIKATTAEKLGFLGRKEGIAVEAVANLTYFDWTQQ